MESIYHQSEKEYYKVNIYGMSKIVKKKDLPDLTFDDISSDKLWAAPAIIPFKKREIVYLRK